MGKSIEFPAAAAPQRLPWDDRAPVVDRAEVDFAKAALQVHARHPLAIEPTVVTIPMTMVLQTAAAYLQHGAAAGGLLPFNPSAPIAPADAPRTP